MQREPQRREVVREDRDDVDAHVSSALRSSVVEQARRAGRRRPRRRRGRPSGTIAATNGTSTSRAVGPADGEHVLAGQVQHLGERRRPASPSTVRDGAGRRAGGRSTRPGRRAARPGSTSATSSTPRSASAAVRSATPSKVSSSRPVCTRPSATVSGPADAGSVRSDRARREPALGVVGAHLDRHLAADAVGRPIRPTTTSTTGCAGGVSARRRRRSRCGRRDPAERADHGAQRLGGAAAAADDLAEVVGVHAHLEDAPAATVAVADRTRRRGGRRCRGPGARAPPRASARPRPASVPRRPAPRRLGASAAGASAAGASAAGASAARRLGSGASAAAASAAGASAAAASAAAPRRRRRPSWRPASSAWWRRPWRVAAGLLGGRLEDRLLVGLRLGDAQRALGAGQALELLPVAGDLEDRGDRLGRLRADAEPVLRALGVDLDERGVLVRVVLADLLDRAAVALGARVGDDDAVVRRADLAEAHRA